MRTSLCEFSLKQTVNDFGSFEFTACIPVNSIENVLSPQSENAEIRHEEINVSLNTLPTTIDKNASEYINEGHHGTLMSTLIRSVAQIISPIDLFLRIQKQSSKIDTFVVMERDLIINILKSAKLYKCS